MNGDVLRTVNQALSLRRDGVPGPIGSLVEPVYRTVEDAVWGAVCWPITMQVEDEVTDAVMAAARTNRRRP